MDSSKHIKIFDTTLRDGQQCPGAAMGFQENLIYAELAAKIGIDVLEAGFPAASELDFQIVKEISTKMSDSSYSITIAALCQLRPEQVDKTIESLEAIRGVKRGRLHIYVPVDPNLMLASLGVRANDKNTILKTLEESVKKSVSSGLEVEFSPEGYSRQGTNFDFVTDLIRTAVGSGASVINCPDTIGGASRFQGVEYFVESMKRHAQIIDLEFPENQVTWSCHCHNDFGLALDNSLNAVLYGPARQIEGCINGIGERAGNVSLEQCVLVIKHFSKYFGENSFYTKVDSSGLQKISDFVAKNMLPRQPHFPIVGDNSAKHSSGGHTNAILKNPLAYQPYDPKEVGKGISMIFGPLSGGNHAKSIIESRGYVCNESEKAELAQAIKSIYKDRRKGITDDELMKAYFQYRSPIVLTNIDYSRHLNHVEVNFQGKFFDKEGVFSEKHEGPDSALYALKIAIDKRFPGYDVSNYYSKSEGRTASALSVSTVVLSDGENSYEGTAQDSDISLAAMKALINATNLAYIDKNFAIKS